MVIRSFRFNIYLLLAAALIAAAGCETIASKSKKQIATLRVHLELLLNHGLRGDLRVHLEAPNDPSDMTEKVSVLRASPITVKIEKTPFLNETHVALASIIGNEDEFIVSIQLNQQGQRLLEQYSSTNPQRRLAIRSQFRQGTNVFDRWLAAPLVMRRISDGVISFSPDADHAETGIFVEGLNNAAEVPKSKKPKFSDVDFDGGPK